MHTSTVAFRAALSSLLAVALTAAVLAPASAETAPDAVSDQQPLVIAFAAGERDESLRELHARVGIESVRPLYGTDE
jgi:hypothetical protein